MTMKEPSRKQLIVPMNDENKNKFIKGSSAHISNLNHTLKGIKSDILANFICSEHNVITIVTNKVVSPFNL